MSDDSFKTIQSLGRTKLIKELNSGETVVHEHVIQAAGDDAAVVANGDDYQLHTSEIFTEGVDFDLTYTPLHHLGYKVLSNAASDIIAMNGTPETALVNIALPNKLSVDMLQEVYRGLHAAGTDYDIQIVGGDLSAAHQRLSISITCNGSVKQKKIAYRNGARKGDAICVTGDLGGAIAGLRILMREKEFWEAEEGQSFEPNLEEYEYVVQRQLVPKARLDVIQQFADLNVTPHAMIDITQGLVNELQYLSEASDTGAMLYQAAIPVANETRQVANEMKEDVDKYALYGGEDLELLFTLPENLIDKHIKSLHDVTIIGQVTSADEGIIMQTGEGDMVKFDAE